MPFFNYKRALFILVLLLATLLRLLNLESTPPNLHADEISFIINSVSLKESGKDEDNRSYPAYLYSIKDFKPALYSYFQIPFIHLLGLSVATSRLPAVLFGVMSTVLFYLFVKELFNKEKIAFIAFILICISPWHIAISRGTQEVITAFFFGLWSLLVFTKIFNRFQQKIKISKSLFFQFFLSNALAMYLYHSYKVYLFIVFFLFSTLLFFNHLTKEKRKYLFLVAACFIIPFLFTFMGAFTRFGAIGLLADDLPKAMIFEYTTISTGNTPIWFLRAFFNKPHFYFRQFLSNYLLHFSGNFLFLEGGKTARYIVPAHGWFYLIDLVMLVFGSILLAKMNKKSFQKMYIFLLILVAPVAASLTTEDIPSSDRSFQLIIPLIIIISVGINWFFSMKKQLIKIFVLLTIAACYAWNFGYFINQYFTLMPKYKQWHRSQDYSILADAIVSHIGDYDRVIISNDLRELYIYLWQKGALSLKQIRLQPLARYEYGYQIDNYLFNQGRCDFSAAGKQDLLVGANDCQHFSEQDIEVVEQTFFDKETPAHTLYVLR